MRGRNWIFPIALLVLVGAIALSQTSVVGSLIAGISNSLLWSSDNTYDIGANGASRPRDLWLGRNATIGGGATVTGAVSSATHAVTGSALASGLDISGATWARLSLSSTATNANNRNWALVQNNTAYGTLDLVIGSSQGVDPITGAGSRIVWFNGTTQGVAGLIGTGNRAVCAHADGTLYAASSTSCP